MRRNSRGKNRHKTKFGHCGFSGLGWAHGGGFCAKLAGGGGGRSVAMIPSASRTRQVEEQ